MKEVIIVLGSVLLLGLSAFGGIVSIVIAANHIKHGLRCKRIQSRHHMDRAIQNDISAAEAQALQHQRNKTTFE